MSRPPVSVTLNLNLYGCPPIWPGGNRESPMEAPHPAPRPESPLLSLYLPPASGESQDSGGAHRIANPVRTPATLFPVETNAEQRADLEAYAARIAADYRDQEIPAAEREQVRKSMTLRRFYESWMLPERLRRVEAGKLSRGSLGKDRQALARWERFTRPDDWPAGQSWGGIPLGFITGRYLDEFLSVLREGGLAAATVFSTWTHLRTILNHAVTVKALEAAPKPRPLGVPVTDTQIYSELQIGTIFDALAPEPPLQVAFVLAINCGPRSVDLFTLRWEQQRLTAARPLLKYESRKTGKLQGIPLAACTVSHLRRLTDRHLFPEAGPIFPGLSSPGSRDPEKSRPARRRTRRFKELLRIARIDPPAKPFQVARATCNERYESHQEGVGQFLLGHSLTLNARSYRQPSRMIREAVETIPQPPQFLRVLQQSETG